MQAKDLLKRNRQLRKINFKMEEEKKDACAL
jgi:hypothetical protein